MSIPLDPRVGGRCISEDELEIADIIVSTTAHFSSSFIRLTTSSAVSHSMLYVGGQVVEAVEEGVVLRSLSAALSDATLAVAYRKMGLTVNQKLQIRDFAGNQLGLKYSYANAAGSGMDRSVGHPAPKPDPYLCAKVGICTVDSSPKPIASDSFFVRSSSCQPLPPRVCRFPQPRPST